MPIGQPNPMSSGFSSFGQNTPKTVAVQNLSTRLLSNNSLRRYAKVNNNGGVAIWVQLGTIALVGQGTRLMPGAQLEFNASNLYLGEINAISNNGTINPNIDIIEGV